MCQWSHLSHFSSCLTVLVLETPHGAVLEVAHGAFSAISWPQPYLCTTLVHMLSGVAMGSGEGAAARRWRGRATLLDESSKAGRVVGGGGGDWRTGGRRALAWCKRQLWQLETGDSNAQRSSTGHGCFSRHAQGTEQKGTGASARLTMDGAGAGAGWPSRRRKRSSANRGGWRRTVGRQTASDGD